MPKDPKVRLTELEKKAKSEIKNFGGEVGKVEKEPIGFGLEALKIYFVVDESRGSTQTLEDNIKKFKDISSVEVIDVRRAIG